MSGPESVAAARFAGEVTVHAGNLTMSCRGHTITESGMLVRAPGEAVRGERARVVLQLVDLGRLDLDVVIEDQRSLHGEELVVWKLRFVQPDPAQLELIRAYLRRRALHSRLRHTRGAVSTLTARELRAGRGKPAPGMPGRVRGPNRGGPKQK